jgi:hypothetical protein
MIYDESQEISLIKSVAFFEEIGVEDDPSFSFKSGIINHIE